jgi:hypothetical protein
MVGSRGLGRGRRPRVARRLVRKAACPDPLGIAWRGFRRIDVLDEVHGDRGAGTGRVDADAGAQLSDQSQPYAEVRTGTQRKIACTSPFVRNDHYEFLEGGVRGDRDRSCRSWIGMKNHVRHGLRHRQANRNVIEPAVNDRCSHRTAKLRHTRRNGRKAPRSQLLAAYGRSPSITAGSRTVLEVVIGCPHVVPCNRGDGISSSRTCSTVAGTRHSTVGQTSRGFQVLGSYTPCGIGETERRDRGSSAGLFRRAIGRPADRVWPLPPPARRIAGRVVR